MVDTMTSWFSVSDALTRVAVMVCVVCVTGGQGTMRIPQCNDEGWLEAWEDHTLPTFMTCEGFGANQNVTWQLIKNDIVQANSTCGPLSTLLAGGQCASTTSDIVVLGSCDATTSLFISNNHRELVGNGSVRCSVDDAASFTSCNINTISPAVLSDCKVTMAKNQILTGNCSFSKVYSSNGMYNCTWKLTRTDKQGDPDVTIPGEIVKTAHTVSNKLYYRGTCSFTSSKLPAGRYSYTLHFYPESIGSRYQGNVTVVEDTTPEANEGVPLGVVIGGTVGGVVFLIIIIVIVVVVCKKCRK